MADNSDLIIKVGADTDQIKKDLAELSNHIKRNPPGEDVGNAFDKSFSMAVISANQGIELLKKAIAGLEAAFDFALKGEEIGAIGARFEILANQAGLVPQNIEEGISRAVKGTVDMEDALSSASRAMATLGENSNKIPEIFELAKKTASVFGGETTDRFEQISSAIASGNTRILRNVGLIVNADTVYKEYAKSIGTAAENLNEAQKQHALMNAVLEKGNGVFGAINSSLTPMNESFKKLVVSIKEFGDTAAVAFNKAFGPTASKLFGDMSSFLDALNIKLGITFGTKVPSATENIKLMQQHLAVLKETMNFADSPEQAASVQKQIDAVNQQILAEQSLVFQKQTSEAIKKQIDDEELARRQNAAAEAALMHQVELENLRNAQSEYEQIAAKMAETGKQLANQLRSGLVGVISNSIQTVVKNLMAGRNAFAGFVSVVANLMGDLAIQMGATLIFAGLGIEALKSLGGAAAIAAGAGLIAIGTILKALSGGGGSGDVGGAQGSYTNPTYTADSGFGPASQEERNTPQTGVQVIVQGNILNSRDSALEIANVLNDAFDMSGTIVRANA